MLPLLTAEQFVEQRYELPDAGQWAELDRGVPTFLQPPDLDHGNVILNLSKALAEYVQTTQRGYACFELGLLVEKRPDTVRIPAACYFLEGPRFSEADKAYTETPPAIVIELASTNDRRRNMAARIEQYHAFGSPQVWVIDPHERCAHVCSRGESAIRFGEEDVLVSDRLAGFRLRVAELFRVPDWWK
jgi:Uma2 family endonuclease